jgi:hypothetical protein
VELPRIKQAVKTGGSKMPMTFETDRSKNLTIFTVTGDVKYDEFRRILGSYSEAGVTFFELYDLRNNTGESFTSEQIKQLVRDAQLSIDLRPKGSKTALVVSKEADYGMARVYKAMAEIEYLTW